MAKLKLYITKRSSETYIIKHIKKDILSLKMRFVLKKYVYELPYHKLKHIIWIFVPYSVDIISGIKTTQVRTYLSMDAFYSVYNKN